MLRELIKVLKKLPVDFGQYELRYTTKGKLIAYGLVAEGSKKKALDVGCRDGYWAEKLKKRGYSVTAFDIDPHYPGALRLDANSPLPFTDDEFDLVWCTEVIEHLRNPAFTVGELKRVLKPEATLILTTPNMSFWVFRAVEAAGASMARLENEEHQYFFSYRDMERMVGRCILYGYFPYLLVKLRISRGASLLSPTIVLRHLNDKRVPAPTETYGTPLPTNRLA